jgi:glycine cleavage system H protein
MAFNTPAELRYAKSHEWVRMDGEVATVGITDYAQDALGDVVYVELPSVGDRLAAGQVFGTVESVKAASDLYAPVAGEVVEVNSELEGAPETINKDPYTGAWMIKIKPSGEESELLDAAGYAGLVGEEGEH